MSSIFAARRKAKVIRQRVDDLEDVTISGLDGEQLGTVSSLRNLEPSSHSLAEPTVKRPTAKSKNPISSRLSFGPGGTSMTEYDSTSEVFTPKKSSLSRQAMEKNALRKSALSTSVSSEQLRNRDENRPSYTEDYLTELKNSTPSAPKKWKGVAPEEGETYSLDVEAKFGTDLARHQELNKSSIPTEAEIQEKKARRARLAKEQKYKANTSGSSDGGEDDDFLNEQHDSDEDEFRNQHDTISLAPAQSKYTSTRLVPDDEDIMEDFESFVEDGRINLGHKAEKEHKKRRREEMRDLIAEAEMSPSDDSEDSERERREAYDYTQTQKGMEGLRVKNDGRESRARTPPKITPVPSLSACLERYRRWLQDLESSRKQTIDQLQDIERERKEISDREAELQQLLKEAVERYEKSLAESDTTGISVSAPGTPGSGVGLGSERGLESFGGTPIRVSDGDNG